MRQRKERQARRGFGVISVLLGLVIFAIIVGVVYKVFTTVKRNTKISGATQQIQTLLATVENIKAQLGGYYPSTSGAVDVSTTSPFQEFLGTNKYAYASWTYNCPDGTDTTVTLKVPSSFFGSNKEAPDICNAVALAVKKNTGWTASCDSNGNLTVEKQHVVCKPAS